MQSALPKLHYWVGPQEWVCFSGVISELCKQTLLFLLHKQMVGPSVSQEQRVYTHHCCRQEGYGPLMMGSHEIYGEKDAQTKGISGMVPGKQKERIILLTGCDMLGFVFQLALFFFFF
jgi:hypothetical protein